MRIYTLEPTTTCADLVRGGDVDAVGGGDGDRAVDVLHDRDGDRAGHVDGHVALVGDGALADGHGDGTVLDASVHNAGGPDGVVSMSMGVAVDVAMGVHINVLVHVDVAVSETVGEGADGGLVGEAAEGSLLTLEVLSLEASVLHVDVGGRENTLATEVGSTETDVGSGTSVVNNSLVNVIGDSAGETLNVILSHLSP